MKSKAQRIAEIRAAHRRLLGLDDAEDYAARVSDRVATHHGDDVEVVYYLETQITPTTAEPRAPMGVAS